MTKTLALISALTSLGFSEEALLVKVASDPKAFWNMILRAVLMENENGPKSGITERAFDELKKSDFNYNVFTEALSNFSDSDQKTILSRIINFKPVVEERPGLLETIGVRPTKRSPIVYEIDPSAFKLKELLDSSKVESVLKNTKVTKEILNDWILKDLGAARYTSFLDEEYDSALKEQDLITKFENTKSLLSKVVPSEQQKIADKLHLRVLMSNIVSPPGSVSDTNLHPTQSLNQ